MEIAINAIKKETEKAMLINLSVCWADNWHARDFWFPKSVVETLDNGHIIVKDWFARKMEEQNRFNGYAMTFAMAF